ncbi:MAG TPA: hypothetical protein VHQ47_17515 [Phycisphaerae bacterium]|nr:hypothetical protein [Phycisphaerae bacterium]
MNRLLPTLAAPLLIALAGCADVSQSRAHSPAPDQWSYAVLSIPHLGETAPAAWTTPSGKVLSDNADALYKKLANSNPSPDTLPQLQLLNLLGAQGWELTATQSDTAYDNYWLKHR